MIWTQWSTSADRQLFPVEFHLFPLPGCVMAAEHQPRSKLSLVVDLLQADPRFKPDSPEFSILQIYLFGATLTSYKTPDGVERTLVLIQLGILVSSLMGPTIDDYGHPAKESSFHLEPSLMERRPTVVDKHRGYAQDVEQRPCRPAMLPTVDCSRRFVAEYLWCSRSSASRTRRFRVGSRFRVDSFRAASLPQPQTRAVLILYLDWTQSA